MENFFYDMSSNLCEKMNTLYPRCQRDNIKIRYGLELFLDSIGKLTIYIIVAKLLGCFPEMVLLIFIFGGLRLLAGGMHMNTSLGCFMVSGIVFVGGARISMYMENNMIIFIVVMCLSLMLVYIYAPSGTINNPINPETYKALKHKSLLFIGTAIFVGIYLKGVYQNIIMVGISCVVLTIIPFTNRKYIKKEIQNC